MIAVFRGWVVLGLWVALLPLATAQEQIPPAKNYHAIAEALTPFIEHEVADKRLPALSIALIDGDRIVWARGFGFQDAEGKIPATAETVYRVGSVSKLFTDIAVMQLVEKGKIDLDKPVAEYLETFRPVYQPGEDPISLRMLMSHRSGLIREPPVGNYFDPDLPSLEATVRSLNGIGLIFPPGNRIKYSNAGIAVVGRTLEYTQGQRFETYLQRHVLEPLALRNSAFEPTPQTAKTLADAVMWSYHGREFPAPTFELGMAPAGSMYSTVLDLGKFASCLFAGGKTTSGQQLIKPETLAKMFELQFAKPGDTSGFGIGFSIRDFEGKQRAGHGGAMYGFATEFSILPEQKLGAVVIASRDVANSVVSRIANDALRLMLANQNGQPLPKIERSTPIPPDEAKALAGVYRGKERWVELIESAGRLYILPDRGGYKVRLQRMGSDLIADDIHAWGNRIPMKDGKLNFAGEELSKVAKTTVPAEPPAKWKGLIGEYGWDHNILYVFERAGQLHCLIEWQEIDPLTEISENEYAFPDRGLYPGERLIFKRDAAGYATEVVTASVKFKRRKLDGERGETFRVQPVKPVEEIRKAALAATPPQENGTFRKPELVDLATLSPTIKLDIRYATENNFLSTPVYSSARAFLQKPAAEALLRVHTQLKDHGYGLLIFDAYRPWYVTKMFWDACPEQFHGFVADPTKGSRHNRGCAVDLGLYDLKTGLPIEVVAGFDEFSDRSYADYPGGTSRQRYHRNCCGR